MRSLGWIAGVALALVGFAARTGAHDSALILGPDALRGPDISFWTHADHARVVWGYGAAEMRSVLRPRRR